ncbi:MAG TPA: hydroxymethylbilane synthase [Vicinamibacterales bacterium]|nr:hydroxymethylbilane synthase [Vicinamibacterales bacterium]
MRVIRIGTRGSALAQWQAHLVASTLRGIAPDIRVLIVEIVSTGDRIQDVPLTDIDGTGLFTAALERALLDRAVDVAVHSYKDLPVDATPDLAIAAVPARGPVEDALCARDGLTLDALPAGARIGTCSARRTAQVRALRPDLDIRPLRGNVPTRVGRVTAGQLDAIVLARAGLVRLGLEACISEVFPLDRMRPAPAQGALAVQCRSADAELLRLLSTLDDAGTRRAVTAERTLLHALGGGCSVPVGAYAACDGRSIALAAGVFSLDASCTVTTTEAGTDPVAVGETAAARLVDMGASAILAGFDRAARLERPTASGAVS